MKVKHLSLRIDDDLLRKLRYVSKYDGRSANSEVLILIKNLIKDFEVKHGEININEIDLDSNIYLR